MEAFWKENGYMSDDHQSTLPLASVTRRDFLKRSSAAGMAPFLTEDVQCAGGPALQGDREKPNVILIISDQFRWDCLGVNGLNPLGLTPNLDAMASEGVNFANAITNQPLCAPSRACLFTCLYANRHGVWRNGIPLSPGALTLAKVFRQEGYSANYFGKWHLGPPEGNGAVAPEYRGGFDGVWEGCNVLELTSHPYEGTVWDAAGQPIHFKDVYRVDFLTDRVVRFLQEKPRSPFLLVISYLEPHFQNDCNCFVAPNGYAERYRNFFIPGDLRFFPGDWQSQLPDYYGCIARVDENVGRLRQELAKLGLASKTIVAFVSDHGCHFRTRNAEYKRSGHEASIHVPLVMAGVGLNRSLTVKELVSQIDVGPTLLDACGITPPAAFQGRSAMPLIERRIDGWSNEVLVQISESMTGRALRTPEWTYVVAEIGGESHTSALRYEEYQLYDLFADPQQLVNLAGRHEASAVAEQLRRRLQTRMREAGEQVPEIAPKPLYP
jgi:arylsulfatase A-like enzyme